MKAPLIAAVIAACVAACGDRDVLAKVGKTKIRQADLDAFAASRPQAARGSEETLRELVARALLAEGARARDLQARPEVAARVAAAEREALAQAFLDDASSQLDEAALRNLYTGAKDRLAKRAVHVAHVLYQFRPQSPSQREEARVKAMRASSRGRAGEDFAAIARTESDDKVSGARGGDDGVLEEGQVDPLFFDRVATLHKGEVSPPIETSYGFFVAKALEEPSLVTPTFEQARGTLAASARREAEAAALERLRSALKVEVHPERLRAVAASDHR